MWDGNSTKFIAVGAFTSVGSGLWFWDPPTAKEWVHVQMLEQHWAGRMLNAARVNDVPAYHAAFVFVGWTALWCLLIAGTREAFCRAQHVE